MIDIEEDCALCGGSGEVTITPVGGYDGKANQFGCPVCIQRELETEIAKLKEALDVLWEYGPRLHAPALVGGGRFVEGVPWRMVVEAAQRHYKNEVTPEKEAERIKKAAAFMYFFSPEARNDHPFFDHVKTLSTLADQAAKKGFCPNCHTKTLEPTYSSRGMEFNKCEKCGDVIVLGDRTQIQNGGV